MKRNKFYLLAAATALFLSACNNEEVPGTQESDLARFTGSIEGVKTRAYDTTWENGDAIGIIGGGYTDIRYVHHNGLWAVEDASGPILFQTPDDVDFTAYYPQGAETTDVTIGANTAQRKIDFLYGTGTGGVRTDGVVDFSFSHRMSRLVLNFIAGPGVDLADLSGYTLSGLSMTGSFDTATGTAYATGAASDLTMDATGITSSSLILFPQEGYEATLKVALGGQTFTATLNLPMADVMNGLESGYSYSYNVTIKKEGLSITQAGIEPWENAQVENSGNVNATI
ncbi:MAG TPA: fimbrillin family protein [Candidatus Avibacteroides excrementipullorum]|nr:fimbrillin family protein [Candidatus Avibacteroides excrementipullorum]